MKRVIRLTVVLLCLLSTAALFAGCAPAALIPDEAIQLEQERGVSYDNTVFTLEISPKYGFCCGRFTIVYSLGADNKLSVHTKDYDHEGVKLEWITSTGLEVTEEQKLGVIQTFRDCSILNLGEIIPEHESFAIEQWLCFYDAEGSEVHRCGGINPTENDDFNAAFQKIFDLLPYEQYTGLIDDTVEIIHAETNRVRLEELGISFDKAVARLCHGVPEWLPEGEHYISEYTYMADGTLLMEAVEYGEDGSRRVIHSDTAALLSEAKEFPGWLKEYLGTDYLYYTDDEITGIYPDGIRPTDRLVPMEEAKDIDFSFTEADGYFFAMVVFDEKGKESYVMPMTMDSFMFDEPCPADAYEMIHSAIVSSDYWRFADAVSEILSGTE